MNEPHKPRFVLIDPSAIHMGGHHYEYAARILRIAKEVGYESELWAHKTSDLPEDECPVFGAFRNTFYDNFKVFSRIGFLKTLPGSGLRKLIGKIRKLAMMALLPFLMRWKIGLGAARAYHDSHSTGVYRPVYHAPQNTVRTSIPVYSFFFLLFTFFRLIKDALRHPMAKRLLKLMTILLLVLLSPVLIALGGLAALYVFLRLQKQPPEKIFAVDLARAMQLRGPWTRQDVLYIPTSFSTEIKGLGIFLSERHKDKELPQFHLLFRTHVFTGHADKFREQMSGRLDYRLAFKWLRQNFPQASVHYYTDTAQLAEQYQMLSDENFTVLPVPVPWMPSEREFQPQDERPLQIVYVGDVRDEKGYQHYPQIVEHLWDEFVAPGKVQFVLQSNFADNPKACLKASYAQSIMRGYAERAVRHVQGPLDSAGYKRLIEEADIILLTYQAEPYMARSSGIFIEAMKAGKPVLMPSMTWMASLVEKKRQQRWRDVLDKQQPAYETQSEWTTNKSLTLDAPYDVGFVGAIFDCSGITAGRAFLELEAICGERCKSASAEIGEDGQVILVVPIACLPGERLSMRYRLYGVSGTVSARFYLSPVPWQGPLDYAAAIYGQENALSMAAHLRELILNIDAYKAQACEFAEQHGQNFTPEMLVDRLLKEARA